MKKNNFKFDLQRFSSTKNSKKLELRKYVKELEELENKADNGFTEEEEKRFDELLDKTEKLRRDIELEETMERCGYEKLTPGEARTANSSTSYGASPFNNDSSEIRAYKPGEEQRYLQDIQARNPLPDNMRHDEVRAGRMICAAVTGRWGEAQAEARTMNIGSDSAGGYLVPEPLSGQIIALALNKMRVRQAGVDMVDMQSKTLTMARTEDIPGGEWLAENAEGSFEDLTFSAVTLSAKKLMVLTGMSVELFEDGIEMPSVVENALADALALELDRVALMGSGSGEEPEGVYNQSGVQEIEHNGGIENYNVFSEAHEKLADENEEPSALIMAPKTWGVIDRLTDTTNQPLRAPQSWEQYRKFTTKQIPTDLGVDDDESVAFLGDWRKLLMGMRSELRIEATRVADEAFKKAQVWLRAYMRADIGISRPKAFCKITGIKYE